MRRLRHRWDDEIWLIHVEANNKTKSDKSIFYSRVMDGKRDSNIASSHIILRPGENYRFIVSRKSMEETGIDLRFDKELLIKMFRLQDRAYLPSNSDIFYSNEATEDGDR